MIALKEYMRNGCVIGPNVDFEGMAEDLCNHLKQNVSAVSLEILGVRSRNEDNSKRWLNKEILREIQAKKEAF